MNFYSFCASFSVIFCRIFLTHSTQPLHIHMPTHILSPKTNIRPEINLKNLKKPIFFKISQKSFWKLNAYLPDMS
jgi:hypothetical protein